MRGSASAAPSAIEVTGEPAGAATATARLPDWSAGPVNAFTLWKPEQVKVTSGADHIGAFRNSEKSNRKWCKDAAAT